jgi:hypothetical protein
VQEIFWLFGTLFSCQKDRRSTVVFQHFGMGADAGQAWPLPPKNRQNAQTGTCYQRFAGR